MNRLYKTSGLILTCLILSGCFSDTKTDSSASNGSQVVTTTTLPSQPPVTLPPVITPTTTTTRPPVVTTTTTTTRPPVVTTTTTTTRPPTPTTTTTRPPTTTTTTTTTMPPVTVDCDTMNAKSCEMFKRVNLYRTSQGLVALKPLRNCINMAQDHSEDMVKRNFFSHDSPTETFQARGIRYGLGGNSYGENIAKGTADVETIFNLWKNSPGHNANMLGSGFRSGGIGFYQNNWTQCFSGRNPQ